MAELVYAQHLKCCAARHVGSIPTWTILIFNIANMTETNDSQSTETLEPRRKEIIDDHFTSGVGLYRDVMNIWTPLPMCVDGDSIDDDFLTELQPLPHYAEYIGAKQYTPAEIDYIFQKSSLEAIAEFDTLIDEYNADLERIKRARDGKKIMEFVDRAKALFKKSPPGTP